MRRLALMIACGALWLILAAVPALADGGPHVLTANNGSLGLNADGCAGCHRAHTAQGPYLINAADETSLCKTCHGAVATGSTVDVMTGVQYKIRGALGVSGTQLGALRNGGFDLARLDTTVPVDGAGLPTNASGPSRTSYARTSTDVSFRPKVPVGPALPVTSSHLNDAEVGNGLTMPGIVWGNGDDNTGEGPALVELSCASCHNPHGNGNYRILNPIPEVNATGFDDAVAVSVASTDAASDIITAAAGHDLQIGDLVKLTGVGGLSNTYTVVAIPSGIKFQVGTFTTDGSQPTVLGLTTTTGTGSFITASRPVTDAPLPALGDTRNYTVIQTKGGQGVDASYLLYASQVAAAAISGNVAAMPTVNIASINALTDRITTATPHGLSVGDRVAIAGQTGITAATYTVLAVSFAPYPSETGTLTVYSPTVFTLVGLDIAADAAGDGTVQRNAIPGTYTELGGDYMHRTVPWNPRVNNTSCSNTSTASTNSAQCGAANDAPNGQPDTITAGPLAGEIAFSTQITAWCTGCHTRYYANQNPNPGAEPGSSAASSRNIAAWNTSGLITTTASHGFEVGDVVSLAGNTNIAASANYTVATVPSSVSFTLSSVTPATTSTIAIVSSNSDTEVFTTAAHGFAIGDTVTISGHNALPTSVNGTYKIAAAGFTATTFTLESTATTPVALNVTFSGTNVGTVSKNVGTVIRFSNPQSASSWWFESDDTLYKFQHRTVPNRACVTCHVSHGSNAVMAGPFSSTVNYPDGSISASSRLLKIDNRGTCQGCHDPTGTIPANTHVGPAPVVP